MLFCCYILSYFFMIKMTQLFICKIYESYNYIQDVNTTPKQEDVFVDCGYGTCGSCVMGEFNFAE